MTMFYQVLAACVGTIAFSVMYNVSKKHLIMCGLCGATGWLVYLLFEDTQEFFGVFLGALVVVLISHILSFTRECPFTIFLIPGIFPLVPGRRIYYAVFYVLTRSYFQALNDFFAAFKYSFAIALAVSVGAILRPAMRRFFRKKKNSLKG